MLNFRKLVSFYVTSTVHKYNYFFYYFLGDTYNISQSLTLQLKYYFIAFSILILTLLK